MNLSSIHSKGTQMAIDRKFLDANHADIVAAILAEGRTAGVEAGRLEGATGERTRIQAVLAVALPGHEQLVNSLAFDGKTTAEQASVQVLAAERQKLGKRGTDAAADAAALAGVTATPAAAPAADAPDPHAGKPLEERCKAKWEAGRGTCAASYGGDYASYLAFAKAERRRARQGPRRQEGGLNRSFVHLQRSTKET
jgi:hypothetical protein